MTQVNGSVATDAIEDPSANDAMLDVAFVGGGLSNCLAALRLADQRPELRIALFEQAPTLGGNHTWSFHSPDISSSAHDWAGGLIVHRWADQEVAFPAFERQFDVGYNSATSERLHDVVQQQLGDRVHLGATVQEADANGLRLTDGRAFSARTLIDGRGGRPSDALALGFQKFLGVEIETEAPHGVVRPMIMDARVPQIDGYRFVYLLPFSPTRLLIEDTYYSDGEDLSEDALEARIGEYVTDRGWQRHTRVRTEHGILPIALAGDIAKYWERNPADLSPARAGLRAALFHPTTGYSLPDAVRFADALAKQSTFTTDAIAAFCARHSTEVWDDRWYYRFLNRMLFIGADPDERRRVMQRFYTLDDGLIARFFAGQSLPRDKARIVIGKPPISVSRALACIPASSAYRAVAR